MSEESQTTPRSSRRGLAIGAGALVAVLGGTRLVLDEVRLARQSAELVHTDDAVAEDLQRDLSQARARAELLATELRQARGRVAEAEKAVVAADARVRKLKHLTHSASGDLKQAEEQAAAARSRAEALGREAATLAKRAKAAEAAEGRARAAAEAAERRAAAAKRAAAAAEAARTKAEAARAEAEAARAKAETRASAAEGTITKLRAAGVNVERLSGKRPMPHIEAIVVQVDATTTPPGVMVNAGKVNGLEPKDLLFVVRGGREVARLEVDGVNDYLSTTRVVRSARGVTLRPGDAVRSQPPKSP